MSAGLYLNPENGIVQIDENYRNLVLVEKASVVTSGGGSLTPYATYMPTVQTPTVVAVSSTRAANIWRITPTGGITVISTMTNTQVDIYLFGMIQTPGLSGAGLEIRNANGEVVFNSNYPPMRVVGATKCADAAKSNSMWNAARGQITGLPTGRKYAGILSHQRRAFGRDLDAKQTYAQEDVMTCGDGYVYCNFVTTRTNGVNSGWQSNPAQTVGGILLAVDVTNY